MQFPANRGCHSLIRGAPKTFIFTLKQSLLTFQMIWSYVQCHSGLFFSVLARVCTVHCRSLLQHFSLSSLCKTFTPECWTKTRKSSLILHARLLCIICTSLVFFAPLLLEAESNDTDKCVSARPKSVMESF